MTDYYATQGRSTVSIDLQCHRAPRQSRRRVFIINEGDRTAIGRITFVGNNAFSESRLRSAINSRKRSIF